MSETPEVYDPSQPTPEQELAAEELNAANSEYARLALLDLNSPATVAAKERLQKALEYNKTTLDYEKSKREK